MNTFFRRLGRVALLSSVAAMTLISVAQAQTAFTGYTSGVQVANISDQTATVTLTAYKDDGTVGGTSSADNINAGASKTYFPVPFVQAGFKGSIVVSANQNVAAISNILDSGAKAFGSYVGRSSGGTKISLPLLQKANSGFTSWFSVQNAGTADATVKITYSDGTPVADATIKPGAAKAYYQSQENHSAKVFAATVESTNNQPLVVAVIQESSGIIFAYTGFTGGSTSPVFPLINANNFGYVTGVQIQNAGTAASDVTVSYSPSGTGNGTACTEKQTIAPGASGTFALYAFSFNAPAGTTLTTDCAKGAKFVGSAKVTINSGNQSLVGIVNQLLPGKNGGSYGSFGDADAGVSVAMPLIMDRNSGFFTGFSVQNIGTAAVPVNCSFSNSTVTVSGQVAAGAALVDVQSGKLADKYVGAATCTSTDTSAKLVGVVNQLGPDQSKDQLLVYEAVKK